MVCELNVCCILDRVGRVGNRTMWACLNFVYLFVCMFVCLFLFVCL